MRACSECRSPIPFGETACPACGAPGGGAAWATAQGVRFFREGGFREAAEAFDAASKLAPDDASLAIAVAHALFHGGERAQAADPYRAALVSPEAPAEAAFNLARILIAENDVRGARAALEDYATRPEPRFEAGRWYLGLVYPDAGAFRADVEFHRGLVAWNLGDLGEAERAFGAALAASPRHAGARRQFGNLLFQARRLEETEDHLRRWLATPDAAGDAQIQSRVDAHYKIGVCRLAAGDEEGGVESFKRVLAERPGHAGAIYRMNQVYHSKGAIVAGEPVPQPVVEAGEGASPTFGLTRPEPAERAARRPDASDSRSGRERPIVGTSVAMQRVLRMARLAAASDATALVTGENGTGKELVARAIHFNSPRRGRPFVPVNCAAIPEGLIESELFGHEKGAFTGAFARKPGLLEAARGGTVFLDEIGEIPLSVQVKLLRFLQEKRIVRVGGSAEEEVDVRVICATNRRLEEDVASGRFREDLYFRLNVLPIPVPPLRERPEDVALLADYFIEKYGKGTLRREQVLPDEDLALLREYEWPGNVRELENIVERAIVMGTPAQEILRGIATRRKRRERREDVWRTDPPLPTPPPDAPIPEPASPPAGDVWRPETLKDLERRHILRTLEHVGGNRALAARLLGINPATLWRKLKAFDAEDAAAKGRR